jgi:hypothetical protein
MRFQEEKANLSKVKPFIPQYGHNLAGHSSGSLLNSIIFKLTTFVFKDFKLWVLSL